MCWWGDDISETKAGTAPPAMTDFVWCEVPEAMLVRAHAASNWIGGFSERARKPTSVGMSPAAMMPSTGGLFSLDRNVLVETEE